MVCKPWAKHPRGCTIRISEALLHSFTQCQEKIRTSQQTRFDDKTRAAPGNNPIRYTYCMVSIYIYMIYSMVSIIICWYVLPLSTEAPWNPKHLRFPPAPRINSTISVFGSLLLFHTFEELLEHYILPVAQPQKWVGGSRPRSAAELQKFPNLLVGLPSGND